MGTNKNPTISFLDLGFDPGLDEFTQKRTVSNTNLLPHSGIYSHDEGS